GCTAHRARGSTPRPQSAASAPLQFCRCRSCGPPVRRAPFLELSRRLLVSLTAMGRAGSPGRFLEAGGAWLECRPALGAGRRRRLLWSFAESVALAAVGRDRLALRADVAHVDAPERCRDAGSCAE